MAENSSIFGGRSRRL